MIPTKVISDRDPRYTSFFWQALVQILNIKSNKSTANHPETDGRSENMVKTISKMLSGFTKKSPKDWGKAFSRLEFDYNCSERATTRLSPFEVEIVKNPHTPSKKALANYTVQCHKSFDTVERQNAFLKVALDNITSSLAKLKFYTTQNRRELELSAR